MNNNFIKTQKRIQSNQERSLRELHDCYADYAQMAPIENLEKQTEEISSTL